MICCCVSSGKSVKALAVLEEQADAAMIGLLHFGLEG